MASTCSSLSVRGAELAAGPNMRDKASQILGKQWHPEDNPEALVNIGTAENHLMLGDVAEFIKEKNIDFEGWDFDYGEGPWGSERLRTALANYMNKYFNPHTNIDAQNLTCANGCSALFSMLSLTLGDPGDGIMLGMPSYVAFAADFGLVGKMKPIFVPTPSSTDPFSPSIVDAFANAYTEATKNGIRPRILMLCNPHNPLGRCYPPSTLIAFLEFCAKYEIHLVVDEIYAMSTYTPSSSEVTPFSSILSIPYTYYISPNYVHHLYGLSKDFASGGLRIGVLHTLNSDLQRAMTAIGAFHWPSTISQIMAATILEDDEFVEGFFAKSRAELGKSSTLARQLLREKGVAWEGGEDVNSGFFLWVDLRPWLGKGEGDGWEKEKALQEKLMQGGVFMTPGRGQAAEEAGWFRLVFSRPEVVLREGIRRLIAVLDDVEAH